MPGCAASPLQVWPGCGRRRGRRPGSGGDAALSRRPLRRGAVSAVAIWALALLVACDPEPRDGGSAIDATLSLRDYGTLGGDFELTAHTGEPFRLAQVRTAATLLFFGYTYCPDFCPVTLSKLGTVRQLLGAGGAQVTTILVSVDPERDTPEKLASYLAYFDPQAIGLTGTVEKVAAVARQYGVTYQRNPAQTAAGYLVDHSTYVFLLDGDQRIRYIFRHGDAPEQMARLMASLLDQ